jgi:replicative DNA helicase
MLWQLDEIAHAMRELLNMNLQAPALSSTPASLPHNLEAEQGLLGALMVDNRLVEDVQLKLRPEHFFEDVHARLYAAILRAVDKNLTANPITLRPYFAQDEALAQLGGVGYLAKLTENPAIIGARDYASQIYDLALLRALVRVGSTMAEQAMDTSQNVDPQNQIQDAEIALYKIAEQGDVTGGVKSFEEAAVRAVHLIEKARKSGGQLSGITTGLTALNGKMGGLHHSDLIILAGRPGMGKTALATNIAFAAALRLKQDQSVGLSMAQSNGAGVAFFSLEMSADQLAARILAEQSNISSENLRMGKLSDQQFLALARAAGDLYDLPLYIDDTPGLTIAALRTRARRLKRQRQVGFIVVDYLQLLQGTTRAGDNRVQEISEITRGLKQLAKELDVPVLALSQLSRAVEAREDKRPLLSDLRESGTIEQDADIVLFVYRDEYYHAQKMPEEGTDKFQAWLDKGERIRGRAEVIVAKQRHGATGAINLMFSKETTKFSDIADEAYLPERY